MSSFRLAKLSSSLRDSSSSVDNTSSSRSSSLNNSSSDSSSPPSSDSRAVDRSAIPSSGSGAVSFGGSVISSAGFDLRFINHTISPAMAENVSRPVPAISAIGLVRACINEFDCSASLAAFSLKISSRNSRCKASCSSTFTSTSSSTRPRKALRSSLIFSMRS